MVAPTLCELQGSRPRVNVSIVRPDVQLSLVHDKLTAVSLLAGKRPDLEAYVKALGDCAWRGRGGRTLELIAHSTQRDCLLNWNGWLIGLDEGAIKRLGTAVKNVEHRNLERVRLIGCRTARTTPGIAAMKLIRKYLGVAVEGTKDLVDATHFTRTGCKPEMLIDVDHAHPIPLRFPAALPEAVPLDAARLVRVAPSVPPSARRRIRSTLAELQLLLAPTASPRETWSMPGLLTRPALEILYRVEPGRVVVAHVLFQWRHVRVFPIGRPGGIIFSVPPGFRDHLRSNPAHRAIIDAASADP